MGSVWMIYFYDYDGMDIDSIWTSKELADKRKKELIKEIKEKYKKRGFVESIISSLCVEEMSLNKVLEE